MNACDRFCMLYLVLSIFSLLSTTGHSTSRRVATFQSEVLFKENNITNVTANSMNPYSTGHSTSRRMATSWFFKDTEIHNVTIKSGTRRIGEGHRCSESDIILDQGPSAPLPSGIPTYTVVLCNACVSGCSITDIHLRCGWFSSARLIDPFVFRRLRFDDCLVNDGKPLDAGQSLTFQYANTRSYPLSISSVVCV